MNNLLKSWLYDVAKTVAMAVLFLLALLMLGEDGTVNSIYIIRPIAFMFVFFVYGVQAYENAKLSYNKLIQTLNTVEEWRL